MSSEANTKLGSTSWISVGLLLGILGAAVTGTVYAVRVVDRLDALTVQEGKRDKALTDLAEAVNMLQSKVDRMADGSEFRVWIANLGRLNPELKIPDLGGPFGDLGGGRK